MESAAADTTLMQKVAQADRAAFDAFYQSYAGRVRAFLQRLLPWRTLIDEVLNDTMLIVWRKAGRYDASCRLSTWIFAIAHRQALRALRRARVRAGAALDDADRQPARDEPDHVAQRLELRRRLRSALGKLSSAQRRVVEMTYFEGHACRDIASAMACPVDTVKTRAFHARRKLRRLLSGEDEAIA